MKTLCRSFSASMLFILLFMSSLSAQAPQKFNYQAVVRNTGGTVIASQAIRVRASIIKDSPTGTTVYSETHTPTTTSLGMVTLAIGGGTPSGDFSMIDWGSGQHYLKIEVDPAGGNAYQVLGTPQLLSVPYSLYSGTGAGQWTVGSGDTTLYKLEGNVGVGTSLPAGKLEVQGDGDETDSTALFEVKRSDGQSVFAVYPGGVEIFVDDSGLKGSKGGFAVGGFGATGKGFTNEFLRVSPDSVRIYIDEAAAKGSKGGFAVGGIGKKKGPLNDFMRITPENYFIGQESGASINEGLYNSFMGYQAGTNTTDGDRNIFLGYRSGYSNLEGSTNIFIGNDAGFANEYGKSNVFIGDSVGFNSTGWYNVFMGDKAGYDNGWGHYNVFLGYESGYSNDTALSNVFIGYQSGYMNHGGKYNVFLGTLSGYENTTGQQNVFLGQEAGYSNTTGGFNVMIGVAAGYENTTGQQNVFLGPRAGLNNTIGDFNIAIGGFAGKLNDDGEFNVYIGQEAGYSNVSGDNNVAIGKFAGADNTGDYNLFLGAEAGQANTGSGNIFIGPTAGKGGVGQEGLVDNMLFLDNDNFTWNTTFMYGELDNWYIRFFADMVVAGDITVNESWVKSDARFKKSVKPIGNSLEKIRALEPVTYEWDAGKVEGTRFPEGKQLGLLAQDVENIFPELVKTDRQGYKAVNYNKLTVVLIEAMKEQQALIEELQQEVAELKAAQQ